MPHDTTARVERGGPYCMEDDVVALGGDMLHLYLTFLRCQVDQSRTNMWRPYCMDNEMASDMAMTWQ